MSETAEVMADAFAAEANTVPVVNVSGVDAQTATESPEARPGKTQKFYTEDDLAKVRAQEKNKLYPELESLRGEVLELKKEKEAKDAAKAQQRAEEEAALRAKQEDELSAKDLLKLKEQEWKEQLEHERQERERAIALLEQEKAFADLQQYRQQRLEQERDNIVPELLDLVHGNSREELDASLNDLQQRSAKILESAQQALVNARKEMPGTRATLPPAGPLETNSEQRQFTADEIASMPMNEYAKYRSRLLSDRAQGKTSGMFGSK